MHWKKSVREKQYWDRIEKQEQENYEKLENINRFCEIINYYKNKKANYEKMVQKQK